VTGPKNLAASVHARLLNRAKAEGRPFDELLTYYAIERFLFRLSRTGHRDRFVLKGALMLPLWGTDIARATRDIDFLGRGALTMDELARVIRDCLAVEVPPDAINFDASTIAVDEIREDTRYGGMRATFLGFLDRAKITMQVDVGLGDAVTPGIVAITYPALLDLPAPELVGYPVETTIAEKLEAIVDLGLTNSRMKDFFDLWSLLGNLALDGETMTAAVKATFVRRGTATPSSLPVGLTEQFATERAKVAQWSAFTSRLRITNPPPLPTVIVRIAAFAMPVFTGIDASNFVTDRWLAAEGWRS
jgi:hypothetical protein